MRIHDTAGVAGVIRYRVYKNDRLIETVEEHNLVVNGGRQWLAELVCGDSTDRITKIGVGEGTSEEKLTDTGLSNCEIVLIDSHNVGASNISGYSFAVTFHWQLTTSQANGLNIREFALYTGLERMVTRQVRGSVIGKANDVKVVGEYSLHF